MKKNIYLLMLLLVAFQWVAEAAPAYAFRVRFKDKNGTLTFADSLQFLSPKALARRSFQGIALDSTDLPVVPAYIDSVMNTAAAVKLHNVSKWFNQIVVITMDSSKVNDILNLPMVSSATCVGVYANGIFQISNSTTTSSSKYPEVNGNYAEKTRGTSAYYGYTYQQVDIMEADCLHDLGFQGQGMDIAVFDVNFRYANSCYYFDSMNTQNRVKDMYNFVKDTAFVFSTSINSGHGKDALSCMAGNIPGTYVGTAPLANFYLYNTEDVGGERPIEEDNWLSAAERADSIGVRIVNSSLGYNSYDAPLTNQSYNYTTHLDGKTTMIAQALNKLSSKGVLVVQAQGNEGCANWHYMLTPADADSAFSVGSVDGSGVWACSGYGPNSAGRVKPDVVCMGKAVMLVQDNCLLPGAANGSSFASPTMCGAVACLWQAFPTKSAYEIKQIIRMSADRYTSPNNTEGYGIPNFCKAYGIATNTTDIKNISNSFALYPNPTVDGVFQVKSFLSSPQPFSYSVYSMDGKRLYQSSQMVHTEFESDVLRTMPSGNYILGIHTLTQYFSTTVTRQ
jgi:serine protease AprX